MHWIVNNIRENAKKAPKKIVFPEFNDERVKEAVRIVKQEQTAEPLLLSPGNIEKKKQEEFANIHYELKSYKYDSFEEVRKIMQEPLYYAAMLTRCGYVDGFVAGASYATSSVIRAALRCLDLDTEANLVSGCFVMAVPDCSYGEKGVFVFSDCAVIPNPGPEQLARIAISAAKFTRDILGLEPRIAFLSFSTKGSAKGGTVEKIRTALDIVKDKEPNLLIDGELQADAALDKEVAKRKLPSSPVAGGANVLIFPNLDSGNISYKLTHRLGRTRALGPIILGLKQPCSDLSRGCSVEDIVDCTALTVVRAQRNQIKNQSFDYAQD